LTANGKQTLSDISATHGIPLSVYTQDQVPLPSVESLLRTRFNEKERKYKEPVEQLGFNFTPLIVETHSGALHPVLQDHIDSRCRIIADRTGVKLSVVRFYWRQKFSCILKQQVGQTILSRVDRLAARQFPNSKFLDQYVDMTIPIQTRMPLFLPADTG
jgi:hypothetical protein